MSYSSYRQWNTTPPDIEIDKEVELVDDAMQETLERLLLPPLHAFTSVAGLLTNTLNLMVFISLGVRDSMSVGIFALTAMELFMSGSELIINVSYVVHFTWTECLVDIWSMASIIFGWIRYVGFFISSWITTVISIERCVCVLLPFKVKQIYTKKRSIVVILGICGFYFSIAISILSSITVYWSGDFTRISNNTVIEKTFLTFAYTELTSSIEMVIDITCAVTLSIISQVIRIACTVLMIYSLKSSSRVRRQSDKEITSNVTKTICWLKGSAMSLKERKMLKVTLSMAILIICVNTPRYVHYTIAYTMFCLDVDRYRGISFLIYGLCDFLIALHSSCNFFVYFVLNTKFRIRLFKLLCLSHSKTT